RQVDPWLVDREHPNVAAVDVAGVLEADHVGHRLEHLRELEEPELGLVEARIDAVADHRLERGAEDAAGPDLLAEQRAELLLEQRQIAELDLAGPAVALLLGPVGAPQIPVVDEPIAEVG